MQRTLLIFLCSFSINAMADGLYSQNLLCEKQESKRSKEICTALQGALEWSWTGHAILSPSFRLSTKRLKDVYCSLPIAPEDTSELVDMAANSENAMETYNSLIHQGVVGLLSLLGEKALERIPPIQQIADERKRISVKYLAGHVRSTVSQSSTSIFSPSHPQYLLRDGCS